jgi:hypothetical protein
MMFDFKYIDCDIQHQIAKHGAVISQKVSSGKNIAEMSECHSYVNGDWTVENTKEANRHLLIGSIKDLDAQLQV